MHSKERTVFTSGWLGGEAGCQDFPEANAAREEQTGKAKGILSAQLFPSISSQLASSAWSSNRSQEELQNAQGESMAPVGNCRLLATFHPGPPPVFLGRAQSGTRPS